MMNKDIMDFLVHFETYRDSEVADVRMMHDRFNFPREDSPTIKHLSLMEERLVFMQEELTEFLDAAKGNDLVGMADALVDLVYFAKGTAVMLGLPWGNIWKAVHGANMEKIPGIKESRPDQTYDLIKPEGWQPANVDRILCEAMGVKYDD